MRWLKKGPGKCLTPAERRKLNAAFAARKPEERSSSGVVDRRTKRFLVKLKRRREVAERKKAREAEAAENATKALELDAWLAANASNEEEHECA